MSRFGWSTALGASLLLGLGCGGQTDSDGAGGGGTGGIGAVSGGGGAPSGGAPSGGTGGCGPADSGEPCSALSEVECLAAHPRCAPVYDDTCCPSCIPTGSCADCVHYEFLQCDLFEMSSCTPGTIPSCGKTPSGMCQGGSAQCPSEPPCNAVPGCVTAIVAGCGPDQLCQAECHSVTEWSCGPTCVPGPLPYCYNGVPEVGPSGYTGYCIEPICWSCPAEQPASGSACTLSGTICQYGSWCTATCTCDPSGVWTCLTPPC